MRDAPKGSDGGRRAGLTALDALNAQGAGVESEKLRWANIHEEHAADLRRETAHLAGDALRVTARDALWHEQQAQRLRHLDSNERH